MFRKARTVSNRFTLTPDACVCPKWLWVGIVSSLLPRGCDFRTVDRLTDRTREPVMSGGPLSTRHAIDLADRAFARRLIWPLSFGPWYLSVRPHGAPEGDDLVFSDCVRGNPIGPWTGTAHRTPLHSANRLIELLWFAYQRKLKRVSRRTRGGLTVMGTQRWYNGVLEYEAKPSPFGICLRLAASLTRCCRVPPPGGGTTDRPTA